MSRKIHHSQMKDLDGIIITNSNESEIITSSATTLIFTGEGILMGIMIWARVSGGTFYLLDADDDPVSGHPTVANPGELDSRGIFPVPRYELLNGLKIVTTSATGIVMTVYYAQ